LQTEFLNKNLARLFEKLAEALNVDKLTVSYPFIPNCKNSKNSKRR